MDLIRLTAEMQNLQVQQDEITAEDQKKAV